MRDEIILEVWRNRDMLAERYDHDLDAIVSAMKKRQRACLLEQCVTERPIDACRHGPVVAPVRLGQSPGIEDPRRSGDTSQNWKQVRRILRCRMKRGQRSCLGFPRAACDGTDG